MRIWMPIWVLDEMGMEIVIGMAVWANGHSNDTFNGHLENYFEWPYGKWEY